MIYYSIADVMSMLGISRTTAYKLAHTSGVPALKIGGAIRFEAKEFDKWCKRQVQFTPKFAPERF